MLLTIADAPSVGLQDFVLAHPTIADVQDAEAHPDGHGLRDGRQQRRHHDVQPPRQRRRQQRQPGTDVA